MPRILVGTAVAALLWLGLGPRHLMADKKNPPDAREKVATDIFTGVVTERYVKMVVPSPGVSESKFLVEVRVDEIERGGLKSRDVVYVRAFRRTTQQLVTGDLNGHSPIPDVGDRVKVYAIRGPYQDTGQTDNGYSAAYANGFEVLPPRKEGK